MYTSISKILEAGLTTQELIHLAENDGRAESAIDFEDTADALVVRVNSFIAKADAWIDSYIAARTTVPLVTVPTIIEDLSTRRTIYLLTESRHRKDMPDSLILSNKEDIKYLTEVQKGNVNPGITEISSSNAFIKTNKSGTIKIFNDDFMADH